MAKLETTEKVSIRDIFDMALVKLTFSLFCQRPDAPRLVTLDDKRQLFSRNAKKKLIEKTERARGIMFVVSGRRHLKYASV